MSAEGVAGAGAKPPAWRAVSFVTSRRSTNARRSRSNRTFAATRLDASLTSVGWSMPAIATRAASSAPAPEGVGATKTPVEPLFEIRDVASGVSMERATRDASMRRLSSSMDSTLAASLPLRSPVNTVAVEGVVSTPPKSKLASAQVPESAFGPGVPMQSGVVHEHGAREEIRGGNGRLHRRERLALTPSPPMLMSPSFS